MYAASKCSVTDIPVIHDLVTAIPLEKNWDRQIIFWQLINTGPWDRAGYKATCLYMCMIQSSSISGVFFWHKILPEIHLFTPLLAVPAHYFKWQVARITIVTSFYLLAIEDAAHYNLLLM